jgi:hypothetical protein
LLQGQGAQASDIKGTVQVVTPTAVVIDGKTIVVDSNTQIEGTLTPGTLIEIKAKIQDDGSILALKIEAQGLEDTDISSEDEDDDDYQDTEDMDSENSSTELKGTITGLTSTSVVVGGKTFVINGDTEIEGNLVVGASVEVEAVTQSNGSLLAVEIEVEDGHDSTEANSTGSYDDDDSAEHGGEYES